MPTLSPGGGAGGGSRLQLRRISPPTRLPGPSTTSCGSFPRCPRTCPCACWATTATWASTASSCPTTCATSSTTWTGGRPPRPGPAHPQPLLPAGSRAGETQGACEGQLQAPWGLGRLLPQEGPRNGTAGLLLGSWLPGTMQAQVPGERGRPPSPRPGQGTGQKHEVAGWWGPVACRGRLGPARGRWPRRCRRGAAADTSASPRFWHTGPRGPPTSATLSPP